MNINQGALVGSRLGKYELLALLAVGGTAEIYIARIDGEAGFEKYVVVKCLLDHLADEPEYVKMFLDEARLGAQLDHSNIVQTLELGEKGGRYFMAMEYLAGLSLAQLARKTNQRVAGGKLPVEIVLAMAAQTSSGLHYAHRKLTSSGQPLNLVHRDISPQNLVVSFDGILKIVDFGIAKADVRDTHTRSGTIKGKFAYMSPEQCLAKEVDHRTDIFALGVILHELLTARRLFKRTTTYETYEAIIKGKVPKPSEVNRELGPEIDDVVMRALEYRKEDRYESAEALGQALLGTIHKRGRASNASDIANFYEAHFEPELREHTDRMRLLVTGKKPTLVGEDSINWGGEEIDGSALEEVSEIVIEGSMIESIEDIAAVRPLPQQVNALAEVATIESLGSAAAGLEEDSGSGSDATRVEAHPTLPSHAGAAQPASSVASSEARTIAPGGPAQVAGPSAKTIAPGQLVAAASAGSPSHAKTIAPGQGASPNAKTIAPGQVVSAASSGAAASAKTIAPGQFAKTIAPAPPKLSEDSSSGLGKKGARAPYRSKQIAAASPAASSKPRRTVMGVAAPKPVAAEAKVVARDLYAGPPKADGPPLSAPSGRVNRRPESVPPDTLPPVAPHVQQAQLGQSRPVQPAAAHGPNPHPAAGHFQHHNAAPQMTERVRPFAPPMRHQYAQQSLSGEPWFIGLVFAIALGVGLGLTLLIASL